MNLASLCAKAFNKLSDEKFLEILNSDIPESLYYIILIEATYNQILFLKNTKFFVIINTSEFLTEKAKKLSIEHNNIFNYQDFCRKYYNEKYTSIDNDNGHWNHIYYYNNNIGNDMEEHLNVNECLRNSCYNNLELVLKFLNKRANNFNEGLLCAIESGNIDIVKLMFDKGANSDNFTECIYVATEYGHNEIANLIKNTKL